MLCIGRSTLDLACTRPYGRTGTMVARSLPQDWIQDNMGWGRTPPQWYSRYRLCARIVWSYIPDLIARVRTGASRNSGSALGWCPITNSVASLDFVALSVRQHPWFCRSLPTSHRSESLVLEFLCINTVFHCQSRHVLGCPPQSGALGAVMTVPKKQKKLT